MDTPELPEHSITSLGRRVHVRRRMAFLRAVFTEPFLPLPADLLALPLDQLEARRRAGLLRCKKTGGVDLHGGKPRRSWLGKS